MTSPAEAARFGRMLCDLADELELQPGRSVGFLRIIARAMVEMASRGTGVTSPNLVDRSCRCGTELTGRQRRWCSDACRKRHERASRPVCPGSLR